MPSRLVLSVDQRRSPRRAVNWRARLLRANGQIVACRTVDRSDDGVGLISHVPMVVGELLQVALLVPADGSVGSAVEVHRGEVIVNVLTVDGYRVGVRLVDPLDELLAEIPSGF